MLGCLLACRPLLAFSLLVLLPAAAFSQHFILRVERLASEWSTVAMIASGFAVVVATVCIESTAVRISWHTEENDQ